MHLQSASSSSELKDSSERRGPTASSVRIHRMVPGDLIARGAGWLRAASLRSALGPGMMQ